MPELISFEDIKAGDIIRITSYMDSHEGVASHLEPLYPKDPAKTEMVWNFEGMMSLGSWMQACNIYRVGVAETLPVVPVKPTREELGPRINVPDTYPPDEDEGDIEWSERLTHEGRKHGVYRQCSLGWHGECSQRDDWGPECECNCSCHIEAREFDLGDEAPDEVVKVLDYWGTRWSRDDDGFWVRVDGNRLGWKELVRRYGPVEEILDKPVP